LVQDGRSSAKNCKAAILRFPSRNKRRKIKPMPRILIIDDDQTLCELLGEYLAAEGFEVHSAHDGPRGVHLAGSEPWDAVILDLMLPGMNGFEVLKRIKSTSELPVLMLTARGEDADTVVGLELGADDYVSKPSSPRVLAARLRALLRRLGQDPESTERLRVGDLLMDLGKRSIQVDGRSVELTGAEFNLLHLLLAQAGNVVSRDRLAEQGLGRPLQGHDRRIETHMAQIRRKLGPLADGSPRIHTVRGTGYQYSKG
jgi:two-component system, OmpR family, response regulator CpxR